MFLSSLAKESAEKRLAVGLHKCVRDLWGEDDFSDFNVIVEGTTFRCHRFILAAVSGFFQGLFRSNMKECQENSVKIEGINQETFRVVLHSVYRGAGGITLDNFLDVWRASDQLQIGFLIDECLLFATNIVSAENCFEVLEYAKMFPSGNAVNQALKNIAKHFQDVCNTVYMMQLSFDDFYNVVKSDFLFAAREDLVLETVINWLSYVDTSSETGDGNKEYTLFDKFLNVTMNNDKNNQVSDASFEDLNNNLTEEVHCSTGADSVIKNGKTFPAHMNQDIKNTVREDGNSINNVSDNSTLTFLSDSIFEGTEGNLVSPSRKRSHSQAGLDDDSESGDGPQRNICRGYRRQHLVDLVGACRLCLVSSEDLKKMLETNEMLSSCPETYTMLSRALDYSLDVGRRHDCWPDQAVHRVNSHWTHVMVYCHNNNLESFDLRTGRIQRIGKQDHPWPCTSIHLAVFDNSLLSVHRQHDIFGTSYFICQFTKENGFDDITERVEQNAWMLAHNTRMYFLLKINDSTSTLFEYTTEGKYGNFRETFEFFHMDANCLVRFNQYILIFHSANDVLNAESYDTKEGTREELTATMRGKSESMTSFTHEGDVYLLQTNGSLWKILAAGKVPSIEFELVTRLGDDNILILGLAMFQSKLHLFVNEDSVKNVTFSENLPTYLPQIVRIPLAMTAEMVPMLVPTDWLQN